MAGMWWVALVDGLRLVGCFNVWCIFECNKSVNDEI